MKVLIVCSGNATNFDFKLHQAFIYDQVESISQLDSGVKFDYFFIKGKGVIGYLTNFRALKSKIKCNSYDLIHAHVALSGLLANLQRSVPVITTFHGSDINIFKTRIISFIVELLSAKTIYVSEKLYKFKIGWQKKKASIIPCGVDFDMFKPVEKEEERLHLGLENGVKYILFSSSFDNKVKNYRLLKEAIELLKDWSPEVLELKGYNRFEVASLMNAVDLCVMTSFNEGSPQFIKEAMASNCPIVSTDVGDVRDVISNTEGCFISSFEPSDVAEKIIRSFKYEGKTNGRTKIYHLDSKVIAEKIRTVYKSCSK